MTADMLLAGALWVASTALAFHFAFRAATATRDGTDGFTAGGILVACAGFWVAVMCAAYVFRTDGAVFRWSFPPTSAAAAAFVLLAAFWSSVTSGWSRIGAGALLVTCSALMTALCVADIVSGTDSLAGNLSLAPIFHATLLCAIGSVAGLWAKLEGQTRVLRAGGEIALATVFVATQWWMIGDGLSVEGRYNLPFVDPNVLNPATLTGYLVIVTCAAAVAAFNAERRRRAAVDASRALQDELAILATMLHGNEASVSAFDRDFRVTVWNPATERLSGIPAADAIGRRLDELLNLSGDDPRRDALDLCRGALDGRSGTMEFAFAHHLTGQRTVWHVSCTPLVSRSCQTVGGLCMTSDLTRFRQLEETARHAQRMEAIGQLTGGMAHDFNNLLHVVQASLPLVKEGDPNAAQVVETALERGRHITRQLLAFAGHDRQEAGPIDVARHAEGMFTLVRPGLRSSIQFESRVEPGSHMVHADARDLDLAVLNLCLNARDAVGEDGRITVDVRRERVAARLAAGLPEGEYVSISVKDNGRGMDPEEQARAFEPFFTTKENGTGLGLAQVLTFARNAGGAARIHSFRGVGTTVTLLLPMLPDGAAALPAIAPPETADTADPDPAVAAPEREPAGEDAHRGRLLVVDDDGMVAEATRALMASVGWAAATAGSAEEALEFLDEYEVDVVLSDVMMPGGMNGYELAERIQRDFPEVRIVLATGFTRYASPRSSRFTTLSKPFNLDDFEEAISALCGSSPAARSSTDLARIG